MSLSLLKSQFAINDLRARGVGCASNGINLTNNAMSATLTRLFGGEKQDWSNIAATSVGQSLGNGIVQGLSRPTFTDEQAQQRADLFILNDEALAQKYDPNYRPAPLFADSNLDLAHTGVLDASGLSVAQTRELQQMQRQRDAASQFIADTYVLSNDSYLGKYFPEVPQISSPRPRTPLFVDYGGGRAVGELQHLQEASLYSPAAKASLNEFFNTLGPIALTAAATLAVGPLASRLPSAWGTFGGLSPWARDGVIGAAVNVGITGITNDNATWQDYGFAAVSGFGGGVVANKLTGSLTATLGNRVRGYDGASFGAIFSDGLNQGYEILNGTIDSVSLTRSLFAGVTGAITQFGVYKANDFVQGNWLYDLVASSRGLYSGSGGVASIGEDAFNKALNGGVFGAAFAPPINRTSDQYIYDGFNHTLNNRHLFQYQPPPYQYMNADQLRYLQQAQQQGGQ